MEDVVSVHAGQCGIQLGASFWDTIGGRPEFAGFYRHFGDPAPRPRGVLVDTDPPLLRRAEKVEAFVEMASVQVAAGPCSWTHAYFDSHAGTDAVVEEVRREIELCDKARAVLMFHALGGTVGGGLGAAVVAALSEAFPGISRLNVGVLPNEGGAGAPYSELLSLWALHDFGTSCVVAGNDEALRRTATGVAASDENKRPSQRALTRVPAPPARATIKPTTQRRVSPFREANDLILQTLLTATAFPSRGFTASWRMLDAGSPHTALLTLSALLENDGGFATRHDGCRHFERLFLPSNRLLRSAAEPEPYLSVAVAAPGSDAQQLQASVDRAKRYRLQMCTGCEENVFFSDPGFRLQSPASLGAAGVAHWCGIRNHLFRVARISRRMRVKRAFIHNLEGSANDIEMLIGQAEMCMQNWCEFYEG